MSLIVVTAAASNRLTTVANVRGDLGLPADIPTNAQIERFIDQASRTVASYCRRGFGRETVRERFEACDLGFEILLDRGPVTSIASVTLDGALLTTDDYETDGRTLFRLRGTDRCCWWGRRLVVQYTAGYLLPGEDDADLPADIERAVILLIGASISTAERDPMVKSEDVEGVGSTAYYVQGAGAALPHPEAEAILQSYRRMLFA